MHVIWAHGQKSGAFSHSPLSGLETEPGVPDFYRDNELKYHGRANRGVTTINFMQDSQDGEQCQFAVPPGCSEDCQYKAQWTADDVNFYISVLSRGSDPSRWLGIGLSNNQRMAVSYVLIAGQSAG